MKEVLETTQAAVARSRHVHIDGSALEAFCRKVGEGAFEVPVWDESCHFRGAPEETVSYLFVLDCLNFCFWPPQGEAKWEITYGSNRLSGYVGLAAALKRALESGAPITKAAWLAEITFEKLKQILGGQGKLPLMEMRTRILNEAGRVLIEDFGGKATHLVEDAGGSAVALVRLMSEKLRSFQDWADCFGERVYFYKRAQIFAADLYGAFGGRSWGAFGDIDELTAFADYKLPQVLRHLGIFVYSEALARKVDEKICLEAGSCEEVEIRAHTVWTVELIRQEMARAKKRLRAWEIDWILWHLGQVSEYRKRPYHRTLTIFY
jgi:hypothetical protein